MLTLEQILNSQSNILHSKKVKLVRHKDGRAQYRDIIKDRQALLEYQRTQGKEIFKDCDYIVSFIGLERSRSLMFGVFKVGPCGRKGDDFFYDLEPVPEYEDLADRLIVDWGNNAIAWHQWHHKQPKEVVEILPKGYIGNFSGLLDFVLDFDELKKLIDNPDANFEWYHHLSAVNGIYMILDTKAGQQYIGSAYGAEGIWQRWSDYARSQTGGNKELKNLIENDPDYHRHFRFSVLQTLPSNITQREIVRIEIYIRKNLALAFTA